MFEEKKIWQRDGTKKRSERRDFQSIPLPNTVTQFLSFKSNVPNGTNISVVESTKDNIIDGKSAKRDASKWMKIEMKISIL